MNGSNGPQWRNTIWHTALAVLAASVAIYLAAELIRDVLPVLIGVGVVLMIGYALWHMNRQRHGW